MEYIVGALLTGIVLGGILTLVGLTIYIKAVNIKEKKKRART